MNARHFIVTVALGMFLATPGCTTSVATSSDTDSDAGSDVEADLDDGSAQDATSDRGTSPDTLPTDGRGGDPKEDVTLEDTPSSPGDCWPPCEGATTCVEGECLDDCEGARADQLASALAPGIKAVANICTPVDSVWGWNIGLDGMFYDVRAATEGNQTRVGLWSWNWWDGAEGAAAAASIHDTVVSGKVELWQVFPSRFVALSEDFATAMWGVANGAAGGEVFLTDLEAGTSSTLSAPSVYGGALYSSFALTTSSGLAGSSGDPTAYYHHNVLNLGGPLFQGLGTSVGSIGTHKGELLIASGYSANWSICDSEEPGGAGQRTFVIPTSQFIERYTAADLPIDLTCDAKEVSLSAEFEVLADGRVATRELNADFTLAGLSVHYWSMTSDGVFVLTNSVAISQGPVFSELRADPHSTKLVLRHSEGYLVVEGPATQDDVVPVTVPEPEPGPEAVEPAPEEGDATTSLDSAPREPTP